MLQEDLYNRTLRPHLDVSAETGRLFGALAISYRHSQCATWAEAARNIGLPEQKGVKTARACSHRLLSSRETLSDAIDEAGRMLPRAADFRGREQGVRRLAQQAGWHRAWSRQHHPGSPAFSQRYAVAWLWTEHAAGHIDTSPGWETINLDRNTRSQYRRYADRLSQEATGALLTLVSAS